MIYLNLSKAFDSVNHLHLLAKLRGYGITPIVKSWIKCFLSQRIFQVNVNKTLSQTPEAIIGVPHGSVIGPIWFVLYVNDRPDHLSAGSLLYADDVKLIAPRNRRDILQNSLNVSVSWSKDWELDLNPTKSEPFPIGNSLISPLTPSRPINLSTP